MELTKSQELDIDDLARQHLQKQSSKKFRRFVLVRVKDATGVSGTGVIMEGLQFGNGSVVGRWLTDVSSKCIYKSMDDVLKIHGHDGQTVLRWID